MNFIQKNRWLVLGVVVVIVGVAAYSYLHRSRTADQIPPTEGVTFSSGNFTFEYPHAYAAKEYATGVASVGGQTNGGFIPLIDIVRYKTDKDSAQPASFDAFVKAQAVALCGGDNGKESLSCSAPTTKPFVTTAGTPGAEMYLTLNRKNLKTATTSTSTYGPIYYFNTTGETEKGQAPRYSAIFVYPTFSSFALVGTTSPEFVQSIAKSIQISQ